MSVKEDILLWISDDEEGAWQALSTVPAPHRESIESMIREIYQCDDERKRKWQRMAGNGYTYLGNQLCLHNLSYRGSIPKMEYSHADGNTKRACNLCYNLGRPCIRLVEAAVHNDDGPAVHFGMFPLHRKYREGKEPHDLEYWRLATARRPKRSRKA